MVSRSIEKMLLIAIGLTTVVIVGIPVLTYSIQTISNVNELENVEYVVELIYNATEQVDAELSSERSIQVNIPDGFRIEAKSSTLNIDYSSNVNAFSSSRNFNHVINLVPPQKAGWHIVRIHMKNNAIYMVFEEL